MILFYAQDLEQILSLRIKLIYINSYEQVCHRIYSSFNLIQKTRFH